MADTKVSEVLLKYNVDQQTLNQSLQRLARARSDLQFTAQLAKQLKPSGEAAAEGIRAVGTSSQQAESRLSKLNTTVETDIKGMNDLRQATLDAAAAQDKLASAPRRPSSGGISEGIKTATEQQGDISTTLSSIASLSGGSQIATLGADLSGVLEYLPRFGEAIKGLPAATQAAVGALGLPNQGIGLLGSLGLIGVVGAGAAVVLHLIAKDMEEVRKANELLITTQREVTETIIGGSQASIQAARDRTKEEQDEARAQIATYQRIIKLTDEATAAQSTASEAFAEAQLAEALTAAGIAAKDFDVNTAINQIKSLEATLTQGDVKIAAYDAALQDLNASADAAAQRLAAATAGVSAFDRSITAQQEAARLAAEGTEQQVQDRITSLLRERQVINDNLPILRAQLRGLQENTDEYDVVANAIRGYNEQLETIRVTLNTLEAGNVLELARANDEAVESEKNLEEQRRNTIRATEAYVKDVERLEQQHQEKLADLDQRYADQQIKIAQKAVEDGEKILQQLQDRRANLLQALQRDQANETAKANFDALQRQIDFQREEVSAEKKHAADLERIRRQSREQEFELGLDRDFAGLARQRRQTAQQITEANIQFNEERAARLEQAKAKNEDELRQFLFEREQRLVKYKQDLTDAQAQYNRERAQLITNRNAALQQAATTYRNDLNLLNQKHTAELNSRKSAITAELQLIAQGNQARLKLEAEYLTMAQNLLRQRNASFGGSPGKPKGRAGGGGARAGEILSVNESYSSGRETFSSSAGVVAFPGAGLFYPARGGQVNAGRSGGNITGPLAVIQITAPDSQMVNVIRRQVLPEVKEIVAGAIKEMYA